MTTTNLTIVVATHNEGKLAEMRQILRECLGEKATNVQLVSAGSMKLPDPTENGVTFEENSLLKARDVAQRTGLPAVADDSGLIVDVMGAAPGILSARWCGHHGDDAANNALLLAQLSDIPDDKRTARFCCAAALVIPGTAVDEQGRHVIDAEIVHRGEMPGVILRAARGEHGFGYDPLFVPDDQPGRRNEADEPLTSAEMTPEEKNAISHRGKALRALMPDIERSLL